MKSINELLTRTIVESKGWELAGKSGGVDHSYRPGADFLWINAEGEQIGFMSKSQIEDWVKDFGDEMQDAVDEVLSLKPGEMYTEDDINIYVRIK